MPNKENDDFKFEIVEHLGVINSNQRGWSKELNSVSWNGKPAKYDIRDWHPDHEKMGRGITLSEEELIELGLMINQRFPDKCISQSGN